MQEIAISKFKATCLSIIEEVQRTGRPVRITRRGHPMAELGPVAAPGRDAWFGSWAGRIQIHGDIVAPAAPAREWNALK